MRLPGKVVDEIIKAVEAANLETGEGIDVLRYLLEFNEGIKKDHLPKQLLGVFNALEKEHARNLRGYKKRIRRIAKAYRRWIQSENK